MIPATASVLGGTDKTEEATRFLHFLLTEESQRYFSGLERTVELIRSSGLSGA